MTVISPPSPPSPGPVAGLGAALDKVIRTLCKRNLAEERRIAEGAPEWRRDEDNRPQGLFITSAGLLALGVEETDQPAVAAAAMPRKRKTVATSPKPQTASPAASKPRSAPTKSKQDLVIQMLRQQSGVTIDDIGAMTGWQPHPVRGFFSGLVRKKAQPAPRLRSG